MENNDSIKSAIWSAVALLVATSVISFLIAQYQVSNSNHSSKDFRAWVRLDIPEPMKSRCLTIASLLLEQQERLRRYEEALEEIGKGGSHGVHDDGTYVRPCEVAQEALSSTRSSSTR